jgi:hypothetical protein
LISNHVVKDATRVRLLTSAGLIDAKVVQVDAANDLALLKADGKFSPLPISSSRSAQLAARWRRSVFPTSDCRGSRPIWPRGKSRRCPARGDDPRYFQISAPGAAGQFGRGVAGECELRGQKQVGRCCRAALTFGLQSTAALPFMESVPDVDTKLKKPNTADEKFEQVVKSAQDAAVLVLVY